jgi:raffinose/stachyose/melibiose transport system permease protein
LSSAAVARRRRRRRRLWPFALACHCFTYLWLLVLLYPILYIVSLSLRRNDEISSATFGLIPHHIRFANYPDAFRLMSQYVVSIPTLLNNSAIVTGGAIVGTLTVAVLASYAFARMTFFGRRALFVVVLLGLIVPIPVMLIPEFITVKTYGLIGTRWALILPYIAFGLPMPILILTTFFKAVPSELFEAASLDGASRFRILRSILIPLARPALATCLIFLALLFWNEFPLALVLVQRADLTTVPLGLASVQGKGASPWELIAAAMLITTLPVVVLFTLFQRQLIEGLTAGSVKG